MKIIIILGAAFGLFTLSLMNIAAPQTSEERIADDEAQMEYLAKLKEENKG